MSGDRVNLSVMWLYSQLSGRFGDVGRKVGKPFVSAVDNCVGANTFAGAHRGDDTVLGRLLYLGRRYS